MATKAAMLRCGIVSPGPTFYLSADSGLRPHRRSDLLANTSNGTTSWHCSVPGPSMQFSLLNTNTRSSDIAKARHCRALHYENN